MCRSSYTHRPLFLLCIGPWEWQGCSLTFKCLYFFLFKTVASVDGVRGCHAWSPVCVTLARWASQCESGCLHVAALCVTTAEESWSLELTLPGTIWVLGPRSIKDSFLNCWKHADEESFIVSKFYWTHLMRELAESQNWFSDNMRDRWKSQWRKGCSNKIAKLYSKHARVSENNIILTSGVSIFTGEGKKKGAHLIIFLYLSLWLL